MLSTNATRYNDDEEAAVTEDTSPQTGGATQEGTARYRDRLGAAERFRDAAGWSWSNVGIGTYLGAADDATDALVSDAVAAALAGGINVVDTAANYRGGRGEVSAGAGLERAFADGTVRRDEVIVCTKAGYLPTPPDQFLETYVGRDGLTENDLVAGSHCLHPAYIADRIDKSRDALGVDRIDVFYLHNPEAQLAHVERGVFDARLLAAFEVLEAAAKDGRIGCYGLATWRAFRLTPGEKGYISLAGVKALARQAAGGEGDRLGCVQMPLALTMPEAVNRPTQWIGDASVSAVAAARLLGLAAVASGSIGQAKVPAMNDQLKKWLGADFDSDHQRALQFTRSASGLTTALVGMKQPAHVAQNLAVQTAAPLPRATFELMFRKTPV